MQTNRSKSEIMTEIDSIIDYFQKQWQAEYSADEEINCFKISKEHYLESARYLREQGFQRLLTISAIDRIARGVFSVYFFIHHFKDNLYVKVEVDIPRNQPVIPSLHEFWPNAKMHEREAWEMFGISFEGNDELVPLFLEDSVEIPPFRKDYNWRETAPKVIK